MFLLALVLAAAPPTHDDARLLTELVASAAARNRAVDVLTGEDVRRAVDLEAERQTLGCAASSCLAEIASAMGAGVVLYGSLSKLGDDEAILTLNVFDSNSARASGRSSIRGRDVKAIVDQIDGEVATLIVAALDSAAATPTPPPTTTPPTPSTPTTPTSPPTATPKRPVTRLLVLDIELRNAVAEAAPDVPDGPPRPLLWAGLGTAAVGVVGVGVGVGFDLAAAGANERAVDSKTVQADAAAAYAERDANAFYALLGYGIGGVLVVGGAALAVVGVQE